MSTKMEIDDLPTPKFGWSFGSAHGLQVEAHVRETLLLKSFLIAFTWMAIQTPVFLGDETEKNVVFTRDIRPLFQRSCFPCHGPDKQKSDYRLDVRESAFKGGESHAPNIVPGKSTESPLIRFVAGTGDLVMPPDGPQLTVDEVKLLRTWIDQGANWPDDVAGRLRDKSDLWSLKPLVRPQRPGQVHAAEGSSGTSVIDEFIQAKLKENGLTSTSKADRRTLIRRVTYDLTGLPASPEEIDQFVGDPDPSAYEKLVDRLLESPRYGERWARHWIDTAHFAETHGHDQDRIREHAWPYRDYLVQSFNTDTPYSRFVEEQIAGDVLFPEDPSATAALGFLAAGPWDESSLRDIREDTIDRQIARYLDRDDMLANVMNNFCSLTVQCARCHDHKFDPISQRDYYSLQAVLAGVERANRRYDADAQIHHQRLALLRRKQEIEKRSDDHGLLSADVQQKVAIWERNLKAESLNWRIVNIASFASSQGAQLTKQKDGSILSGGPRPETDTVTLTSAPFDSDFIIESDSARIEQKTLIDVEAATPRDLSRITAIRLEVLTDESLPRQGPGRQDNGNFHLSEFEVFVDGNDKPIRLVNPTADFNQSGWEISKSIDGNESTAWGIDPKEGMSHQAVFELKEPMSLERDATETPSATNESEKKRVHSSKRLRIVLKQLHGRAHLIGRMRISVTDAAVPVRVGLTPEGITSILAVPPGQRSEAQRLELTLFQQMDEVTRALSALPSPSLVYAAAADFEPDGSLRPPPGPRPVHVLHRGDIRQPRDEVTPGAIASVVGIPARFEIPVNAPESARRAALAKWLTHRENPLTWRSIVNRIWHHHFGRGIVGTLNDFGHMGESPSHAELLDWLAVEFRDNGQSMKQLHRLIVKSQTYQQSVENPRESPLQVNQRLSLDGDNRLLWRMNRTRLDAESIRDAVLAFSGRLDFRMGGPSDRQFDLQPGIHVTPKVDYGKFDHNSDPGRRRSIYRFLFRTLPDPFMESLDCPSGDQITPSRVNNVTVQQALALWNDVFIANHCVSIAERIESDINQKQPAESDGPMIVAARIDRMFQLILNRRPSLDEIDEFSKFSREHGLANACRLLLNSNEFLFVN